MAARLAGLSVLSALVALLLRSSRPDMGQAAAMLGGVSILLMAVPLAENVLRGVCELAERGGVPQAAMEPVLKIAGVTLLMDFAAQTCRDAGENGLALKTELAGRVLLLSLALPAMRALLERMLALLA